MPVRTTYMEVKIVCSFHLPVFNGYR